MVTHADGVGVGESEAKLSSCGSVILANAMEFATKILHGRLHIWKNMAFQMRFELRSSFFHVLPAFPPRTAPTSDFNAPHLFSHYARLERPTVG